MDNDQIKLILSGYRPSGQDACDPFFAEALEQVDRDPELAKWFKEQLEFDQKLQGSLLSVEPPATLRDSLILNKKVVSIDSQARDSSVGWWGLSRSRLTIAAIAALLAGIAALAFLLTKSQMSSERFVEQVVDIKLSKKIALERFSKDERVLRAWLAGRNAPHDFAIPSALDALASIGCQAFSIDGNMVSLICFRLDGKRIVHLFVIDSDRLKNPPGAAPSFQKTDIVTSATWSSEGKTFVLLGAHLNEDTLQRLI